MSGPATPTRRQFLQLAASGTAALLWTRCAGVSRAGSATGWDLVPEIVARIRPPTFPDRDYDITRYGAVAGAARDATAAIRQAIAACSAAGGGRVVVPPGEFLTAAIHLKSNVNLHVAEGATLRFSTRPADYPIVFTRWEGMELLNYSPLVYAFDQVNIAITGAGTLDGQAAEGNWWPWKGAWKTHPEWANVPNQLPARDRLIRMVEAGVPVAERVFGEGDYLRPQFIQPYRCRNVLIEGVTLLRAPMWQVHPVLCANVSIRDLRIISHGPNNDGCNPESSRDVLIDNCYFDTGDDCIAIKSGRNADGRRLDTPSERIVIRNCRMKDGHGGVTIGSEMSGGVRHVFAEQCEMDSPNLERALRFKTNAVRGGFIEDVYMRNVRVGQVSDAVVHVDFHYEEGAAGPHRPVVQRIDVRAVTSGRSNYAFYLRAFPTAPMVDVHVADCRFDNVARGNVIEHVHDVRLDNVFINGREVTALAGTR